MSPTPPSADDLAQGYSDLTQACDDLRHGIADERPLETCLEEAEAIGRAMAALPDPRSLAEAADPVRLDGLRGGLEALRQAHTRLVNALKERLQRQRSGVVQEHRRGEALRAYQGGGAPTPRFHDRRG